MQGGNYVKVGTLRTHKDGNGFREVKSGIAPTIPARAREDGSGRQGVIMYPHGNNPGGMKKLPNLRAHSGAIHNEILYPQIRRLTPVECERLQGFPDNWTESVSDTQRYKCLGNAVTVNVVAEIFKRLK